MSRRRGPANNFVRSRSTLHSTSSSALHDLLRRTPRFLCQHSGSSIAAPMIAQTRYMPVCTRFRFFARLPAVGLVHYEFRAKSQLIHTCGLALRAYALRATLAFVATLGVACSVRPPFRSYNM